MTTHSPSAAVETTPVAKQKVWWTNLGIQVAIGLVLGIVVGLLFPAFGASLQILGDIFLRMVKVAIAPLVFLTISAGIVSAGDFKRIGKLGLIAIIYYEIVSSIALGGGMVFGKLFGVGEGLGAIGQVSEKARAAAMAQAGAGHTTFNQFLLQIFPDNFVGAFANGALLQVLVIAILFGIAVLFLKPDMRSRVEAGLGTISACFFQLVNIIMLLAPIGTFGAAAYTVGANGVAVLISLAYLVLAFYAVILIFCACVLLPICWTFGVNFWQLLLYIKEEIFIVLGTSSSESVLPRLLEKLEVVGCSKQAVGLVLPGGYAFNLDGASIYMSICIIFIANAYNVPLTFQQEVGIFAVMLLTSKGAATVAGGSFVILAATVATTGLPIEGLPVLFGVYRFMSMVSATCNMIGNSVATIVVSKLSGEFDEDKARRFNSHLLLGR